MFCVYGLQLKASDSYNRISFNRFFTALRRKAESFFAAMLSEKFLTAFSFSVFCIKKASPLPKAVKKAPIKYKSLSAHGSCLPERFREAQLIGVKSKEEISKFSLIPQLRLHCTFSFWGGFCQSRQNIHNLLRLRQASRPPPQRSGWSRGLLPEDGRHRYTGR